MSLKAIIEIELLSETVFGGDGSVLGTADIEIQTDEHGLPYLAGRTLKGLIREQAEWYNSFLPQEERLDREILRLFGKPWEDNHEGLRFGHAKLCDAIYEFVNKNHIDAGEVLNAVTNVRSMTSIDESGKAAKGTLRQARLMKPGFKLYAPVFANTEFSEQEGQLLEKAVKLVRHVGLMRNRGKGEVRCQLKWIADQTVIQEPVGEGPYYELTIYAHEPLKISQVLGTSDSSHALGCIPGYVLRGALVRAYLQSTGKRPEELETEEVFDPRKVQFWNGYLALDGKRGLPFAQHLFEKKQDAKELKKRRPIYQSLDEKRFSEIRHDSPVRISRDVMVMDKDVVLAAKVRTSSALHLSLVEDARRSGRTGEYRSRIYRYEALDAGQVFKAVVFAPAQNDFVQWLTRQKILTLWLGGARNSGYGRTTVKIEAMRESPERMGAATLKPTGELYVLAASDWIIRDRNGRLCSAPDAGWLGEQLGVELELEDQVVNTQLTGGYISQWQAYQPSYSAVQAGSIYKYRVMSGELDEQRVRGLMEKGIGARVNEGFGRLILFTEWPYTEMVDCEPENVGFEEGMVIRGDVASDEAQIERIIRNLADMRLQAATRERVAGWIRDVHGTRINSSKWGTLWQVSSEILADIATGRSTPEKAAERWGRFWKDVDDRTNNKRDPGLNGVRIGKSSLREFIFSQLAYTYKLDDWLMKDDRSLYWNLRALELFFRQKVRSKTSTGKKVAEK
ncbi:putative RAMP superfamily protein probably involved in DNA repair [Thermobacillus composti KWC4]|uniref:Putative RAMP superfamily protein probably involved in DNA repair n=1 Tax=Thermobacillus composti (strain DSM 18247 / JCM 13945 / KWC4) TaxID=717605 RepID=L0EHK6_THECK|nr:RAMP superfamily CRISPR-associated protein [Thermobacillus composti]AGA59176.1 putative RAMP superfamily protein probably involved in DNA repair [Thermobacillus composti KWC4]